MPTAGSEAGTLRRDRVVWASTGLATRGGVSGMVAATLRTPLRDRWRITHVATHRDGSALARIVEFVTGTVVFVLTLVIARPSLVHLHTASYGSFVRKSILLVIARAARVPVVMHVHGAEFHLFYARLPRVGRRWVTWSLQACAAVVALGPGWAARLAEIAPHAHIVVIPNATVLPVIEPASVVPRPAGEVSVVFLGRVERRKGVFDLIRAWPTALEEAASTGARLRIAGDGELAVAERMASELGVSGSVQTIGWVDPTAVPSLLADADVLVLPSYDEGQPMAVLEAMAAGLCVVTCPVGGIPDLVDDHCAVLVPPGDVDALSSALAGVIADDDLRRRLGSAARARAAEQFDVDVVWRRIDDLYREVVG